MLVSVVGASDHAEGAPLVFYYVLFTFGKRSIWKKKKKKKGSTRRFYTFE